MMTNQEIYEFILGNIRQAVMPEELVSIDAAVSRLEVLALLLVHRQPDTTMSELAQNMRVPVNTATGVVNRLVKKGLISRGGRAEDRRVVTVRLADDGKVLVEKLHRHFNTLIDRVRGIVTDEEFAFIIKMLRKVMTGLRTGGPAPGSASAEPRKHIAIE